MPSHFAKFKAPAMALTMSLGFSQIATAGELTVSVSGLRSDDGGVICRAFEMDSGFPSEGAARSVSATPSGAKGICAFADLAPGVYAIAVAHDEDGDGELDRNFLGIPTEGFGFSRNPRTLLGPPDFEEAAITVDEAETGIEINVSY